VIVAPEVLSVGDVRVARVLYEDDDVIQLEVLPYEEARS
jgi:hypothetical protein